MDEKLRNELREHLHAAKALLTSLNAAAADNGRGVWKYSGFKVFMRNYNALVGSVAAQITLPSFIFAFDLDRVPGSCDTIAAQQQDFFQSVHANLSLLCGFLESKLDLKADEITNLSNFFQINLRKVMFAQPTLEVEVQNAVEQLLIGRGYQKGLDYDRETGRVKVSIKEVIPDFIFPRLGLALEVKLSKDRSKSKEIVDEINADIQAYGKKYAFILFVVYDLGSIRDESEFKNDLEATDSVYVIVVKH
jgi:hypothetical protein